MAFHRDSWLGRIRRLMICALLIGAVWHQAAYAGNGTFKDGKFTFCVSVRFNATPAQLQQIRTAFQNASQILADATDGQHRFGTVRIVNNSGASATAEFWVNSGTGRAYATQGKYGVRGEHVNLFFESDFQGLHGSDGDAYTIAHEHAHHAYGILDEYSGPSGDAECAPRPDSPTLNFSLMDNFWVRGGGDPTTGTYTLNEFCVLGNHDPDKNTWQHAAHERSAWEVIATHPRFAAFPPGGLPISAAPPSEVVDFSDWTGGLTVMLLIDRSGSMVGGRIQFAKSAANLFTKFLRTGDRVGVASFSSFASLDFPLTAITGDSTRAAVQTTINSLAATGATNVGDGLFSALGELTSQSQRSCNEIIVLLSDGDHNTGTDPSFAIPLLRDECITVLTVGVGFGLSIGGEATLQSIASQTGGKFFRIASNFGLVSAFLRFVMESMGNGLLTRAPSVVGSSQTAGVPVLVEVAATSATFALAIENPTDVIEFSLRSPSGILVTAGFAATTPNITFRSDLNSQSFQVDAPEFGMWSMNVSTGVVTNGNIEFLAFSENEGVQLNVSTTQESVAFPEEVEIHATPTFRGESVVGATVSGTVNRPDGSVVAITLHDDGAGGDAIPDDGVYSGRFSGYTGIGVYTFELSSNIPSTGATTFSGEDLFVFAPSSANPVGAFTRSASATALVTGVPVADIAVAMAVSSDQVSAGSNLTYSVTVTNGGPDQASGIILTDTLPSGVTVVSMSPSKGTCTLDGTGVINCDLGNLASGEIATVTVVVTAKSGGSLANRAAVTSIGSDPIPANNSASVTSTVTDYGVSVSPSSATVGQGQRTNLTVTVSPEFGPYDSAVLLSCSGLPAHASCAFSPATVTPGASPVDSSLTISTTASSTFHVPSLGPRGSLPLYALGAGFAGLVLLGLRAALGTRQLPAGWALAVTLVVAGLLVAGCAGATGGSGNQPPPPREGTPPGTYTITITGTSGSMQRSTTVTLTVQ